MRPNDEKSGELMSALKAGRQSALSELVGLWEAPLLRFVYRYVQNEAEARDLVQETFVRVFLSRERFREGSSFVTWAFTIAANLCRNHQRWLGRHPTVPMENSDEEGNEYGERLASPGDSPDRSAQRMEQLQALKTAIAGLPHDLRTVLLLFEYEQMSYREIAQVVGCSERGVESRLLRARSKLRKELQFLLETGERPPASLLPEQTGA